MGGVAVVLDYDAELMLRVKQGDAESFALLLEKYRGPVAGYLHRMLQDQGVAEELAQEVFLRVYRSRERYEPTAKFTTWVFRIATHLALNCVRDRKGEKFHESLDDSRGDAPRAPDLRFPPFGRTGPAPGSPLRRSAPGRGRPARQAARRRAHAQV